MRATPTAKGGTSIFSDLFFFAVPSNAFLRIHISGIRTVWFLYEFIQTNSYILYTNCIVRIRTRCGFCTYQFIQFLYETSR